MSRTKKIAFSGIFSALCFVFLYIGSVFQTLDLSASAIGSIVVLISMIELGKRWALGVYAVSGILAVLLLPNKSPAVIYLLFAGFYPVFKTAMNSISKKWLSYTARLTFFNAAFTLLVFMSVRLFGIEEDYIGFGILAYAVANITFIVYDFALEMIAINYISRIRPMLFGKQ